MAVLNKASLNEIINSYDANKWAKRAEINEFPNMNRGTLEFDKNVSNKDELTFGEMLSNSLKNVNEVQKDANMAIQKLVTGESKNIHETMLIVEKAEMAFKAMNQIRMKVIDAYKEVMRMQV